MLIISIPTTYNTANDLKKLDQIITILDCYPGDEEVRIKLMQQTETGLARVFCMPQQVDNDVDMLELLYGIDDIDVEIE